jgi:membrane protein
MNVRGRIEAFDRFQRRHAGLAIPVAVLRNLSDQGAGNAAVLIAYWAFFSLFPLLLVFVSILGFVLQGDLAAQKTIEHSALTRFPIVGVHPGALRGSGIGLAIGLAGTLLSGLGVTLATENALQTVYMVPRTRRPNFLSSRWRGLKLLVAAGLLQVLSTVAAGVVSGGFGGPALVVAGLALSLVLNLALFFVVFRVLIPNVVPLRELWPGIVIAAVGWEVLQSVGGLYVAHVVKGAGQTYGSFATVIGLLAWLYLGARVVVYAAEINVVLTRRLWPRSILDPPEPADHRVRAALAKLEERDAHETVTVAFHPEASNDGEAGLEPTYTVVPEPAPGEPVAPEPAPREPVKPEPAPGEPAVTPAPAPGDSPAVTPAPAPGDSPADPAPRDAGPAPADD